MGKLLLYLSILVSCACYAQQTNDSVAFTAVTDSLIQPDYSAYLYDANRPAKAAFLSAVLPGLGQAYNGKGKFWKIPIIYGALGGSIFAYVTNQQEFNRLREAFQIRLSGGTNDEFSNPDGTPIISTLGLERSQRIVQRNRDLSLLITATFYALQIIEANVSGHLSQFDVDRDLSFKPYLDYNQSAVGASYGFAVSFTF